jgi:glutamate/aspartate transport system substrate-binding protein
VQLYGMLAETRSAADFRVVGDFLTYADYALMYRKNDLEFAEVVERAFHKLAGSREIVAIYERWFKKLLPSGLRLNLPMSPHLEEIFRVQGLRSD